MLKEQFKCRKPTYYSVSLVQYQLDHKQIHKVEVNAIELISHPDMANAIDLALTRRPNVSLADAMCESSPFK